MLLLTNTLLSNATVLLVLAIYLCEVIPCGLVASWWKRLMSWQKALPCLGLRDGDLCSSAGSLLEFAYVSQNDVNDVTCVEDGVSRV